MVLRQPIGLVAAFTPWNAPASSPIRKISGALAAGCSIILKAAEETPGSACAIVECFADAGLPAGVLNLVFGDPAEISNFLIASPIVRLVTFTGSVQVGRHLGELAARHIKPTIMELGGHSPVIICHDADPVSTAKAAAISKFRWAGQIRVSPTRFIVHRTIHDDFLSAFVNATKSIKVGAGTQEGTQMGPLANSRRLGAMEALVRDATNRGATIETGGQRIGNRGFFFEPTVISRVPLDADVLNVEPFGPIAPVVAFDDLDDAIQTANGLPFGLASYAFTQSAETRRGSRIVSINHFGGPAPELPFGGVKESGNGREGGAESLDGYSVIKMVSHRQVM
jgi:succinate-semialdehyde dehydrogenase/glutarate-semialdehyde dehydrogenase